MSDRDEVRKLAEEILRLAGPTTHLNYPAQLEEAERRLLAFLAQRESALQGQLHRALGEGVGLRGALEKAADADCTNENGANCINFDPRTVLYCASCVAKAALEHTASPLSERAGAVIAAGLAAFEAGFVDEQETFDRFFDALIALRDELQKGGDDA